jgi:hypothetical protein
MKIVLIIFLLLIPVSISCGESDPVREFVLSQPQIAIDMTGYRSQFKDNWELKRKNFKAGSRRNK